MFKIYLIPYTIDCSTAESGSLGTPEDNISIWTEASIRLAFISETLVFILVLFTHLKSQQDTNDHPDDFSDSSSVSYKFSFESTSPGEWNGRFSLYKFMK